MKYVIFKNQGGLLAPIIFPEHISHKQINLGEGWKAFSAGFCYLDKNGLLNVDMTRPYAESLGIEVLSPIEDKNLLFRVLNSYSSGFFIDVRDMYVGEPKSIIPQRKMVEQAIFTPDNIGELGMNDVFVFGSNLNGNHAGGAARTAVERFGAEMGVAEGITGKCYALPTLDENMEKVEPIALKESIMRLVSTAVNYPALNFYITKIGCGIAGWEVRDVSYIVFDAIQEEFAMSDGGRYMPKNIYLPQEFVKFYEDWKDDYNINL